MRVTHIFFSLYVQEPSFWVFSHGLFSVITSGQSEGLHIDLGHFKEYVLGTKAYICIVIHKLSQHSVNVTSGTFYWCPRTEVLTIL